MSFRKNLLRITFLASLFTFLLTTMALANIKGVLKADNVNVRSESNTNSNIITKLNSGAELDILGEEENFYKINIDGAELFIAKDFVDITKTVGTVTANGVNIRQSPSLEAEVIGKADSGSTYTVLSCQGDWIKLDYNNNEGFISKDFLSGSFVEDVKEIGKEKKEEAPVISQGSDGIEVGKYAVVTCTSGLRFRESPDTNSNVLAVLNNGEAVDVIRDNGEWLEVNRNGVVGHISSEYVAIGHGEKPVRDTSVGNQIVEYGKQFLGTPYQWAGNSLTSGVDCSGFVYNVFKNFGINLNRSSRDMPSNGTAISKESLEVGDLVFFDTSGVNDGNISHVGIYMGGNQFIHSSSSRRTWGVTISSMQDPYYIRTYVSSARVL